MASPSSKSSPASSGPVIDAEWRPVPEPASASTALAVSSPPVVRRPVVVVRRAATRAPAMVRVVRCPVCGRPGPDVKAKLGPVTVKVCVRCAKVGHFAAFVLTKVFG